MDPSKTINEVLKEYNTTPDYTYKQDAEIYQRILMSQNNPNNEEVLNEFMNIITRNEKYDLNSFFAETSNQMQKAYDHIQVTKVLSIVFPLANRGPIIEMESDYIPEDYEEE